MKYLLLLIFGVIWSLSSFGQSPDLRFRPHLVFGSGGGVVGKETTYVFLENGALYKRITEDSLLRVRLLYSSTAKRHFATARRLRLAQLQSEHPGNLYYFVKINDSQKNGGGATWGQTGTKPPAAVKAFYDNLVKLVPKK